MILLICSLFFILSTFSDQNKTNHPSTEWSSEFNPATCNAGLISGIQTFIALKTWISNDACFRLLSFKEIQYLENRNTGIVIFYLTRLFKEFHHIQAIHENTYISNPGIEPPPVLG